MKTYTVNSFRVAELPADGPMFSTEQGAADIIGDTYGLDIDWVAIPVSRLAPDFFKLRTGLAGGFIQKLINYRLKVAFIGDISVAVAASDALRDFVTESNRGQHVFFVTDSAALVARLEGQKP